MSKLETNTIDTVSGTSTLQVGSTNTSTITLGVSGDTINVPSGVTIANSGTATGFAANTPAFEAYLGGSGGQSISDNTVTKVQCQTEVYDTDNAYDNSTNYRFTPQTAGKYLVYASIQNESGSGSNLNASYLYFKFNGSSNILESSNDYYNNQIRADIIQGSIIVDMNGSSDYVELYGRIDSISGSGQLFESDSQFAIATHFGAYRIIT